jgi:YfiH family protein
MLYRQQRKGLEWLQFELFKDIPHLHHAVFLRHGGVSQGDFTSLNVGLHVGDAPKRAKANRMRIEKQLQETMGTWKKAIWSHPCNKDTIIKVDNTSRLEIENMDGVFTSTPGISLMMTHADCQVALFYDPIHRAIANIHAGWRGNVMNIYRKAIQYMRNAFHSNPSDLLVCISPSLGPAESEFIHYKTELPEKFWEFQIKPFYFDLWAIAEYQLQKEGILPHHIEIARLSTFANPKDYFSYRRDRITGRHATCITLL